jgi:hypothetical protein
LSLIVGPPVMVSRGVSTCAIAERLDAGESVADLAAHCDLAPGEIELRAGVRRGLLRSDTVQGKVRFGLPLHALRFYFPALWPQTEADTAAQPQAR